MREKFAKIFGNEDTKLRLSDWVSNSRLPHALMLVGPEGSGKHTMAIEIAAALNCQNADNEGFPLPCGTCNRCRRIYSGNFPDISKLSRQKDRASIGVEEVREFRAEMFLSATESQYKLFIIEEADLMTRESQNALLKVLEEPPENVHIILLCREADKILTTIKSRAQIIQTELFEQDKLSSYVKRLSESARGLSYSFPERFKSIILSSGGVIGRALYLLDENNIAEIEEERALICAFLSAIPKKVSFTELHAAANALSKKREELRKIFEDIRNALRDMILLKFDENTAPSFFLSADEAFRISGSIGKGRLVAIYDIITDAISDLDKNVNISVLLTDISVQIKEA